MEPLDTSGTIALDAMGGDLGPPEIVEGLRLALASDVELGNIILVGDRAILEPEMRRHRLDSDDRVSLFHASQVISMEDKAISALKQGKDSSMVRAIELVKDGRAKAVISCGNTGSLMAGGTIKLRPLEGIDRPALACFMPDRDGHFVLCDAGANPDARHEHLVHNAILASHYAQVVLNISSPRIGLLTIGTEEGKGNERIHETHRYLKDLGLMGMINYRGLIEGFQVFDNEVDVIICDGFVGNILLKTCEGLFQFLKGKLQTELRRNLLRSFGALLSMGAYRGLRKSLAPEQYAGARLLGLRGHVFKSHGNANRHAIAGALKIASRVARHDMTDIIRDEIQKANRLMKPAGVPEKVDLSKS